MKKDLKKIIIEKGQGLTEYVLILAFIAGVAFMMFGGDGSLKGTVVDTFTETGRILAGLFDEKTDWGKVDRSAFNDSNKEERLAADQSALMNLATFFIGKTRAEMIDLLSGNPLKKDENGNPVQKTDNNGNPVYNNGNPVYIREDGSDYKGENDGTGKNYNGPLGWIVQTENGMHFLTKELSSNESDICTLISKDGKTTYTRNYNDQVLSWLQGDYSGGSYDSSYTYMVSDYAVKQYDRLANKEFDYTKDPQTGGNGVKMRVEYDKPDKNDTSTWTVKSVKLVVDSASQNKDNGSKGLEVMVKKNSSGNLEKTLTTGYTNNFN